MIIWIVVYLVLGVLTYGMGFAHFQRGFPTIAKEYYRTDMSGAVFFALFTPLTTIIIFFISGFAQHGLKFK